MKKIIFGLIILTLFNCTTEKETENSNSNTKQIPTENSEKIRILNFGSVHLSMTSDANSSKINLNNPNEVTDLKKLVDKIVEFKPTIICLELEPKNNEYIASTFLKYKKDQTKRLNYSDELNSIGLEVARLSGTERIYGIDSQIGFDYPSLIKIANKNKSDSVFIAKVINNYKRVNVLKLKEQFQIINTKEYKAETFDFYNFLATKHTETGQEGAEEIAKFYERNLKMYSNFNDIEMNKNDRVFILLGATHTAYFDVFIENNETFKLENPSEYTNF
ncbi:hypothetical protein C7447_104193 [Tenacibaculum adriaticum]|uniref:TraB family protein n=1 Tax=Tenacibaculum adriaticum TaxID=413713 RepID=A0A5S5DPA2_9FLAO|nr:DUF5694 domain-containing protein [Tenacibaculum adriaticum]TYP97504.1 hypothetical protein C7447_104193 [Tenacibaculum adriaticum]